MSTEIKDTLLICGFASIFNIIGVVLIFVMSSGSRLECDRWTDSCVLSYTYFVKASESHQWKLSETDRTFVSTVYPTSRSNDTTDRVPTHRAVIVLKDNQQLPFTLQQSKEASESKVFVEEFTTYLETDSLLSSPNGKFSRVHSSSWILWVSGVLNAVGILIFGYGCWGLYTSTVSTKK